MRTKHITDAVQTSKNYSLWPQTILSPLPKYNIARMKICSSVDPSRRPENAGPFDICSSVDPSRRPENYAGPSDLLLLNGGEPPKVDYHNIPSLKLNAEHNGETGVSCSEQTRLALLNYADEGEPRPPKIDCDHYHIPSLKLNATEQHDANGGETGVSCSEQAPPLLSLLNYAAPSQNDQTQGQLRFRSGGFHVVCADGRSSRLHIVCEDHDKSSATNSFVPLQPPPAPARKPTRHPDSKHDELEDPPSLTLVTPDIPGTSTGAPPLTASEGATYSLRDDCVTCLHSVPYLIHEPLGKGASADVYRVELLIPQHTTLRRKCGGSTRATPADLVIDGEGLVVVDMVRSQEAFLAGVVTEDDLDAENNLIGSGVCFALKIVHLPVGEEGRRETLRAVHEYEVSLLGQLQKCEGIVTIFDSEVRSWAGSGRYRKSQSLQNPHILVRNSFSPCRVSCCLTVGM